MDFFEAQDAARKRTKWLVALFILAVAMIIVSVYGLITIAFYGFGDSTTPAEGGLEIWNLERFLVIAGITIVVVAGASFSKLISLRDGGSAVAEMMGARRVDPNTHDANERRLMNVVEEMAIASGVPVPAVYVIPGEKAINAFAAGYTTSDAAVAVTEGTIERLTRDELQGVVAHEFSHILNSDMRLNIRLIGVLHGILVISLIGAMVMRSAFYASAARTSSRDRGGGQIGLVLVGIGLYIIGSLGVFFGRLIQSAVSRQREFLADSSAVQFTRNPDGIVGALKKIGGMSGGSKLSNPHTQELSHSLFSDGVSRLFGGGSWFSTHPPLSERIRAIDPSFDGKMAESAAVSTGGRAGGQAAGFAGSGGPPPTPGASVATTGDGLMRNIGAPSEAHLTHAAELLAAIPDSLRTASHDPEEARALVYCLLIDERPELRDKQLGIMRTKADPRVAEIAAKLLPEVDGVGKASRLPLMDLALPALRMLSPAQYERFSGVVHALIEADGKVTLFDFVLMKTMERHLAPHFSGEKPSRRAAYHAFPPLANSFEVLMSALAHAGGEEEKGEREKAFSKGSGKLPFPPGQLRFAPAPPGLQEIDTAIDQLQKASLPIRRRFIQAAAEVVAANGEVNVYEAELIRAICDGLDCPMPPVLAW